jgi:hypothetical protein
MVEEVAPVLGLKMQVEGEGSNLSKGLTVIGCLDTHCWVLAWEGQCAIAYVSELGSPVKCTGV